MCTEQKATGLFVLASFLCDNAYDAIVFSLRLSFFASQAVVRYKFIHGVAPNLVKKNCKPVQEYSYRCLAIPNIYKITTFVSLYNNNGVSWAKMPQRN